MRRSYQRPAFLAWFRAEFNSHEWPPLLCVETRDGTAVEVCEDSAFHDVSAWEVTE